MTFFRGLESEGYPYLETPFQIDCIAIAAFRNPKMRENKELGMTKEYVIGTYKKIENIFKIALDQGHDSLVLSGLFPFARSLVRSFTRSFVH